MGVCEKMKQRGHIYKKGVKGGLVGGKAEWELRLQKQRKQQSQHTAEEKTTKA